MITQERYEAGLSFSAYLDTVQKNAELWRAIYAKARVPDAVVERIASLQASHRILVLSEDWCGDAVNIVPVVTRLQEACPNLVDLRVLPRDQNLDIMDAHLTGTSRSIPVVILLDETFQECAWWGPRPAELQQWILGAGQEMPADERYREARRWYARDGGRTTLEEITRLLERC
jgi:hypothetical protein